MAALSYPSRAYQATAVDTSDPNHQVVLLFDASVRFLSRAREAMEKQDYEGQCTDIVRTQKILTTLMAALDMNANPEMGQSLYSLYSWLHTKLTEASIHDDVPLLDDLVAIVTDLRDAWREAELSLKVQPSAAAAVETEFLKAA
jgi:flagellar secretion chaperone FliS